MLFLILKFQHFFGSVRFMGCFCENSRISTSIVLLLIFKFHFWQRCQREVWTKISNSTNVFVVILVWAHRVANSNLVLRQGRSCTSLQSTSHKGGQGQGLCELVTGPAEDQSCTEPGCPWGWHVGLDRVWRPCCCHLLRLSSCAATCYDCRPVLPLAGAVLCHYHLQVHLATTMTNMAMLSMSSIPMNLYCPVFEILFFF